MENKRKGEQAVMEIYGRGGDGNSRYTPSYVILRPGPLMDAKKIGAVILPSSLIFFIMTIC